MNYLQHSLDNLGILTVTLNRPEKLNALNTELLEALEVLLTQVQKDASVKALLITGEGKAFCAGADIHKLAEADAQSGYEFACFGQKVFRHLEALGKPSLAAVNGFAFGGGCELALAASLRIASDKAVFAQPEVKLGVIPGYGGTVRLARIVGKGRALDLCLTGRSMAAATALSWGLVSEVVPLEGLIPRCKNILAQVLELAPLAITSILEVMDYGYNMSLSEAMHLEAVHFSKVCASSDKNEGVQAFLEKRKAHFQGK